MKILFVFPNYDCPLGISIGVAYLSAALKENGHETHVLHISDELGYPFDVNKIVKDILQYSPGLVAISTGENHYADMCVLIERLKQVSNIPIALGGIHITLNADAVMEESSLIDFGMIGEGDDAIVDLANAIENKKDVSHIPNIWYRSKNGVIKNRMRPLKDITVLPPMDLDTWDFEKITKQRRGWVNVSMNRGCPYRCSFCHNVGEVQILKENFKTKGTTNRELGYLRLRGVDNMIKELQGIIRKYPYVTEFSFIDDTFTFDKEHMKSFFKEYANKVGIPFVCLTTVNDVDEELIALMKTANCDMIRFGVESATPRIRRDIIRRNFSNEKLTNAFALCKKYDIRTFAYNIIAHPTESLEEIRNTLRLNAKLLPEGVRISLGYPYKGTLYYDIAKKMNQIEDNTSYHNYSTRTKFKFTDEEKLWIDKCRCYFKWWLNLYLNNESTAVYKQYVEYLENLSESEWNAPETRKKIQKMDEDATEQMKLKNILHYTSPFSDRPDIAILYDGKVSIKKEELDEH